MWGGGLLNQLRDLQLYKNYIYSPLPLNDVAKCMHGVKVSAWKVRARQCIVL